MSSFRNMSVLLALALTFCFPSLLSAQSLEAPRTEVFGGYSWYKAGGMIDNADVPSFRNGWDAQYTSNSKDWAGLLVDVNGHYKAGFGSVHLVSAGFQVKLRGEHFTPFAEALFGVGAIAPIHAPSQVSGAFTVGAGVDYKVTPSFSFRLLQLDYVNTYYDRALSSQGSGALNGVRAQAGAVFSFGLPETKFPVSLVCTATPAAVAADSGTPVKVAVTAKGFPPKHTLSYSYLSTGGKVKVEGNKTTASVDTTGLQAGSYTVSAKAVDNGKRKHQLTASCKAQFAVNAKHPPTLSVSAAPDSLKAGEASTITATGNSDENRPLSYTCTATGGQLTGNGPLFTLDTSGAASGTITVKCTVADDRNLTATAQASVDVHVPAPATPPQPVAPPKPAVPPQPATPPQGASPQPATPSKGRSSPQPATPQPAMPSKSTSPQPVTPPHPATSSQGTSPQPATLPQGTSPQPLKFGTIEFKRDVKRPTRVDNEAKGELDRYADALAAEPESEGVVVGYETAQEAKQSGGNITRFAALRAVNTKDYVSRGRGVDPARIESRVGSGGAQRVELWIVPAAGRFAAKGTITVNESKVHAVRRVPLKAKRIHKRAVPKAHKGVAPKVKKIHRRG